MKGMYPDPHYAAYGVFDSNVLKKAGKKDPSSPHTIEVATLMLVRGGLAEQTKGHPKFTVVLSLQHVSSSISVNI